MGTARATKDFEWPTHIFDKNELDLSKTTFFKKDDELPIELVKKLEITNPEHVYYLDGKSKVEDVKGDVVLTSKGPKPKEESKEVDWKTLNKDELDKYAESEGIKLDRRKSLEKMQEEFKKEIDK